MIPANGRRRRAATLSAALLCAGLMAGCGGDSDSAANGGPPAEATSTALPAVALPADLAQRPACGTITLTEVEAAIGAKVAPPKEEAQTGRSLCSFGVSGKPGESVLLISTSSSGVPAYFTTAFNTAAAPQAVSAGDQAFVSGAQGLVRKGNTMVAVLVLVRQSPAQLTAAAAKLVQAVGTHI